MDELCLMFVLKSILIPLMFRRTQQYESLKFATVDVGLRCWVFAYQKTSVVIFFLFVWYLKRSLFKWSFRQNGGCPIELVDENIFSGQPVGITSESKRKIESSIKTSIGI